MSLILIKRLQYHPYKMLRSKYWIFRWVNLYRDEGQVWRFFKNIGASYMIFQQEEYDPKTKAYIGYVEFRYSKRLDTIKCALPPGWPMFSIDRRRGSQLAAVAYSTKEDGRVNGPWEHGHASPIRVQGQRTDLVKHIDDEIWEIRPLWSNGKPKEKKAHVVYVRPGPAKDTFILSKRKYLRPVL